MDTPVRRLRMEDELWNASEGVAGDMDRSVSWVIRKALEEYIERHRAAKRAAKQAAFEQELDEPSSADRKTIASKRTKQQGKQ